MEQTGVDAREHDLDVPVSDDRSLRNGSRGSGSRRRGCRRGSILGLELLGLDANAVLCLGEDVLGDGSRGVLTQAIPVGLDEHGQVESRHHHPVLVALTRKQAVDLVEGSGAPKVDKEEHVLLFVERCDGILQLRLEVIGAHVGREGHGCDVLLWPEDHLAGLHDPLGELAVTG